MAKYEMKYMYDWGSGTCVWSTNEAARDKYNYPVAISKLPISDQLKNRLMNLIEKHDEALDWNNPAGDLLWSEEQQIDFEENAIAAYKALVVELGKDYYIELWKNCLI